MRKRLSFVQTIGSGLEDVEVASLVPTTGVAVDDMESRPSASSLVDGEISSLTLMSGSVDDGAGTSSLFRIAGRVECNVEGSSTSSGATNPSFLRASLYL